MNNVPADPEQARRVNRALILDQLRRDDLISRAQISRRLGLSKMTVSAIVSDLLEAKLVTEYGQGISAVIGGRKPILLTLDSESQFVVGIDIGTTNTVVAVSNLKGKIIAKRRVATVGDRSVDRVVEQVAELVRIIRADIGSPGRTVLGVGLSIAGLVSRKDGVIALSPDFDWKDVPIGHLVSDAIGLRVAVDNCTRCMARGERWYGAATGARNLFFVNVGHGIGSAMIINGEIYDHNSEFGHLYITKSDVRCDCGNYGCLEAVASGQAIERQGSKLLGRVAGQLSARDLAEMARAGNVLARKVYAEAGRYLGRATSLAVNLFSPEKVIIGGGVAEAGELLLESVRTEFSAHVMPVIRDTVSIELSSLHMDAGVVGAVALALNVFVFSE